jgi:hypothetical protein
MSNPVPSTQSTTGQSTTESTAVSQSRPETIRQTDLPVMPTNGNAPAAAPDTLYCANHPNVETLLRCNRCEKPICLKCATLTDVGYRCNECIRGVQASYFNAAPMDNLIGFGVALLVTAVASPIAGFIFRFVPPFIGIILAFMIGSGAGGVLAQIIRSAVGRRRGRYLRHFALAGIVLGVLIGSVVGLLFFRIPVLSITNLIFMILSAATAYRILR